MVGLLLRAGHMMENYTRDSKSDLSGMTPQQALQYLSAHYKTDEDLSVGNIGLALGPWLAVAAFIGGLGLAVWGLLSLL